MATERIACSEVVHAHEVAVRPRRERRDVVVKQSHVYSGIFEAGDDLLVEPRRIAHALDWLEEHAGHVFVHKVLDDFPDRPDAATAA